MLDEEQEREAEKLINDEYMMWKKNTPFLYELVMTHALEWPSLTVEWLPNPEKVQGDDYTTHRVLLGTHTSEDAQNHLLLADVRIPIPDTDVDIHKFDDEKAICDGFGGIAGNVDIKFKVNHEGEVHRSR
jgi:histone-binding protein RBBP4